MFKKTVMALAIASVAGGVSAAKFDFHGDLNNRFQVFTDQNNFFNGDKPGATLGASSGSASVDDSYAEIKYRLWTTMSTDDDAVKGVYAMEVGGVRFGRSGSGKAQGGGFSGDGANVETRWAYTQFKVPGEEAHSVKVGLLPYKLNSFLWSETATGIVVSGPLADSTTYSTAWVRGKERRNKTVADNFKAVDGYSFRVDNKSIKDTKLGAFILYQVSDAGVNDASKYGKIKSSQYGLKQFGDVNFDIFSLGVDGSHSLAVGEGSAFVKWDLIYQTGNLSHAAFVSNAVGTGSTDVTSTESDFDVSAYFANLTAGFEQGGTKYSYTLWYASGDNNPNDKKMNAFLSTDVDRTESIIFFEGGYTDDQIHTERPYIMDKGILMNRFGVDHKLAPKLTVGGAGLYMMTAKDVKYSDDKGNARSSSDLGLEFDAYAKYMIHTNLEFSVNAGYLLAGDAMDYYDSKRDGNADNNILRTTARLRYKF